MIDEISLTPDAEGHLSLDVDSSQRNNAVDVHVAWNDPVNFVHRRVDSTLINLLINKPYQPDENYTFPKTNGRSCLHAWFRNTLPDGTTVKRRWLSYSAKEVWTTEGFMVGSRVTVNVAYRRMRLLSRTDNLKLHIFIGQQT